MKKRFILIKYIALVSVLVFGLIPGAKDTAAEVWPTTREAHEVPSEIEPIIASSKCRS
jgi:hypothetical protein